jgi:hypothetical protein
MSWCLTTFSFERANKPGFELDVASDSAGIQLDLHPSRPPQRRLSS